MKRIVLPLMLVSLLAACSSTSPYEKRVEREQERRANAVERSLDKAPSWMLELPKDKSAVYSSGTAVSGDFNMALGVARTNAFEGICMAAGGAVKSQSKVFRSDTADTSSSMNTTAIKTMCPTVDITGAEVVESKVVEERGRYRAYVLTALPMGEANTLKRAKVNDMMQRSSMGQRDREFHELDNESTRESR